jgi:hypothetical protein
VKPKNVQEYIGGFKHTISIESDHSKTNGTSLAEQAYFMGFTLSADAG